MCLYKGFDGANDFRLPMKLAYISMYFYKMYCVYVGKRYNQSMREGRGTELMGKLGGMMRYMYDVYECSCLYVTMCVSACEYLCMPVCVCMCVSL